MAHEINNPLQTVVGSVELMLEDQPAPRRSAAISKLVRTEAARAAQIVRSLLAIRPRADTPARVPVELNQVVREAVGLREFQFQQKSIRLSMDLRGSPPWFSAAGKNCSRSS